MKKYLVRLTPLEPYFFGNEKCFSFDDGNPRGQMSNRYYIRSERTPLQTTLLGAMRYLFIPTKKSDFNYDENEYEAIKKYIGSESFKIASSAEQDFGVIKNLSPLFLMKGAGILIPTPLDHIKGQEKYTPFDNYKKINTADGIKLYTDQFDVKTGLSDSYTDIDTKDIVACEEIFSTVTRVGINRNPNNKAFFKKDYITLQQGYCFAFCMELSDEADITSVERYVYLGQGKSLFTVSFEPTELNMAERIRPLTGENAVYCFGDTLAESRIYDNAMFSVVDFRDYRAYETLAKGKVKKDTILYRLIKAGSIFIVADKDTAEEIRSKNLSGVINCCNHKNCRNIGFNEVITKNGEEQRNGTSL